MRRRQRRNDAPPRVGAPPVGTAEENARRKKKDFFPASTRDAVRDVRGVRAARKTPSRIDRFGSVGIVRDVRYFRDRKRLPRSKRVEAEGTVRAEPSRARRRRLWIPNGASSARGVSKPRAGARVRPSRRLGARRRRRARARGGGARRRGTLHVARRHERDRRRRRRRALRRAGPAATPLTRLATLCFRERATRPFRRSIASAYAVPGVTTPESWSRGGVVS